MTDDTELGMKCRNLSKFLISVNERTCHCNVRDWHGEMMKKCGGMRGLRSGLIWCDEQTRGRAKRWKRPVPQEHVPRPKLTTLSSFPTQYLQEVSKASIDKNPTNSSLLLHSPTRSLGIEGISFPHSYTISFEYESKGGGNPFKSHLQQSSSQLLPE